MHTHIHAHTHTHTHTQEFIKIPVHPPRSNRELITASDKSIHELKGQHFCRNQKSSAHFEKSGTENQGTSPDSRSLKAVVSETVGEAHTVGPEDIQTHS